MKLSFTKMQGCANDYIYLDCRASGVPADIAALAQRLSARHFSVGADGIICICAPVTPGADGRMRIFNADGSEAQMCGNGVRCVAEWLYTHGVEKPVLTIDTNSGVKRITRQGAQLWQVEMGAYSTLPADLPAIHMGEGPLVDQPLTVEGKVWKVTCISVGNPHCVTVVEDVDSLKLEAIGPSFEHHANFPERITAAENELTTLHQQQAAAQIEVEKPFPQEEELAEKSARLAELNAQLDVDEKQHDEPEQEEPKKEDAPRPSVLAALEDKADKVEPVKPFKSYFDKEER